MRFRPLSRKMSVALPLLLVTVSAAFAQQAAAPAAQAGQLTVDRIYGQPSLSGRLTRGIAWSLDGKKFSFFEAAGTGKEAKPARYVMDVATGQRSLLIAADKLESVLRHLPANNRRPRDLAGALRPKCSGRFRVKRFCLRVQILLHGLM
jgi:hypothetical protein